MSHKASFRGRPSSFHILENKHLLLHQVAHDLNPKGRLWDLVITLDIKLHSRTSLLIADDMASRRTKPQTTSRHIAADIQLRLASRRTRHEDQPLNVAHDIPTQVVSGPASQQTLENKPHSTSQYMSSPGYNATSLISVCRLRPSNSIAVR